MILNMLAAFILSFLALMISLTVSVNKVSAPIYAQFYEMHPEFAGISPEEEETNEAFQEAWNNYQYELPQDWEMKVAAKLILYMVIGGFGTTLLIIWLFVFKIRRRIVRELNSFDAALGAIPEISGGNPEASSEIHSRIREFDQICLRFNQISNRLKESELERKKLEGQQRKMIADISHDLKTPITVIQGYSKAVRDNVADDETKNKYLDAICRKSEMVTELINTFHEYSKLDHPDNTYHMTEGDLCEYLRGYLAMKYQELDIAGFSLDVDLPEQPIPFTFDQKQFVRIFENLISNSFRYNEPGTELFTQLTETDDSIVIRVGDNGRGIPENMRDKIFEPFVVGTESRTNNRGSGLGLAIVRRIVEAHQGTIELIRDPEGVHRTLYEIRFPKS